MGFNVNLYVFSKKVNSTAIPTGAPITHSCILKDPCGILNPTIGLNLGLSDSPAGCNYAYIPVFNRYYYIKEWTFQNALWYASLEVDTLASWKTQIGASTCYVLRSSGSSDGTILDTTYPATGETTFHLDTQDSPWIPVFSLGRFIVGIAGINTRYFVFTETTLNAFFAYLFSDEYAAKLTTNWVVMFPSLKAQCNPLQYITSIMWIPFTPTATTDVATIKTGWVDVPQSGKMVSQTALDAFLYSTETAFTIAKHPQASRGSYLNNSAHSTYTLFFPPWGKIQLDADIAANSTQIIAQCNIDLRTCEGTLIIKNETGYILSKLHAQIGVPHQVTQIVAKGYGIANIIQPAIGAATGAIMGGAVGTVGGTIVGTVSQIGNMASSKIPTATTIGSNGGLDSLLGIPCLQHEFKTVVSEDLNHRGRPLCVNRQINTLSGFIMVADADIDLTATKQEQESVRSFMEGGFFFE